jgi:cystathionine beta-lyase/cystathionine gamma-synthase
MEIALATNAEIERQQERNRVMDPSTTGAFDDDGRARLGGVTLQEGASPGSTGEFIYARYSNPTVIAKEREIARLEDPCGGTYAALTSSGMAAIDVALGSLMTASTGGGRPWMFEGELYGGTIHYVNTVLSGSRGVPVEFLDVDAVAPELLTAHFVRAIEEKRPPVVFVETISNPRLLVMDVAEVAAAARRVGAVLVVDNTFATPLLLRPLGLGAHLVVHSATKYLAGHGIVTAGVVCGRSSEPLPDGVPARGTKGGLEALVRAHLRATGPVLSARDAFELGTQLKTLPLRVAAANENAAQLAALLAAHPKVRRVHFPGLRGDPNRAAALRNFGNGGRFGAIVTPETVGPGSAERLMSELGSDRFRCRLTLGDVETTLFRVAPVFGVERFGGRPEMLRISVGVEPWEELEGAFRTALDRI